MHEVCITGAFTVTVAGALCADPPAFVAVAVYVVVDSGHTIMEPVALSPDPIVPVPLAIVTVDPASATHDSFEHRGCWPEVSWLGSAVKVTAGAPGSALTVTVSCWVEGPPLFDTVSV